MSGRTSKYKPQYKRLIIEYFNRDPYYEKVVNGRLKLIPCQFPTFNGFASIIDVNGNTLVEWAKEQNH